MIPEKGSAGVVPTRTCTIAAPVILDGGAALGPVTVAYETYGELDANRANAVLICHALSGDAHVAGYHADGDAKPGWWDGMVGPGKAFDTAKYFVICSNVIGGCMGSTGPSSINPATGKPYGLSFPVITIGDMVKVQRELVRQLGIERLLCVAGGSMGGMQALEWAIRFPEMVRGAAVISAAPQNGAQQIAFHAVGRHAIQTDPDFHNGDYYDLPAPARGLAVARMLAHITYLSDESMRTKFGRNLREGDTLRFDFEKEFAVETYLKYQGEKFVERFDANSYLYVTKAIDYFDVAAQYGSLDAAMERIQGRVLLISYSTDWLYPPSESEAMAVSLTRAGKNVSYCNLESNCGHDAFLVDMDQLEKAVAGFLKHTMHPERPCDKCNAQDFVARTSPPVALPTSIYVGRRVDYDLIVDLVEPGSRVLDIGCGGGELLCRLDREKKVRGMGLELREDSIVSAIGCGLPVIQADIDKGLHALPGGSFDYVLLSMTLQVIQNPDLVLREMLRVGKKGIVSFPNFGYWKVRAKAFFSGRAPVTRNLPYSWHDSPNRHVLTIKDFRRFCEERKIVIEREVALFADGTTWHPYNVFAEEALYILSHPQQPAP